MHKLSNCEIESVNGGTPMPAASATIALLTAVVKALISTSE